MSEVLIELANSVFRDDTADEKSYMTEVRIAIAQLPFATRLVRVRCWRPRP